MRTHRGYHDTGETLAIWCLLIWLLGMLVTPGYWWHGPCATPKPSDQLYCTATASLFWPVALPVNISFRIFS